MPPDQFIGEVRQVSLAFDLFCHIGDNRRVCRKRIADHQWQTLYTFLQGHPRAYAGQEEKFGRVCSGKGLPGRP